MKKYIKPVFQISLTFLFLVGCKGSPITKEEATSRAQTIEEYYSSDEFEVPTKFSVTQDTKIEVSSIKIETKIVQTLDLSAKYYYSEVSASAGEESEFLKSWIYYQTSDNKTYFVVEDNTTKFHTYFEGDVFVENANLDETIVADVYGDFAASNLFLQVNDEDSRNVYRSSGEGSLYLKVFIELQGENAYSELQIDNYMVILAKNYIDDNNHLTMKFKYSGISTSKPNLRNYPYAE